MSDKQRELLEELEEAKQKANHTKAEDLTEELQQSLSADGSPSMTPSYDKELELIKEQQRGLNPNAESYLNTNINANGAGINQNVDPNSPGDNQPDQPKSELPKPSPGK